MIAESRPSLTPAFLAIRSEYRPYINHPYINRKRGWLNRLQRCPRLLIANREIFHDLSTEYLMIWRQKTITIKEYGPSPPIQRGAWVKKILPAQPASRRGRYQIWT